MIFQAKLTQGFQSAKNSKHFTADQFDIAEFRDTRIGGEEPRAQFLGSSDNAIEIRPPRQIRKPYGYFREDNTFFGSGFMTSDNIENRVLAVNNDVIFEHFVDSFPRGSTNFYSPDVLKPISGTSVNQSFEETYEMFGAQIRQFKGSQVVDLGESFKDVRPWILGVGTFQDANNLVIFENVFSKCSTG